MDIKTQKMLADVVLNAQNKAVKPYTTTATVKSVNNGIVYVEIPGSDRDTPVKNSSVSVKKGDVVDLVVSHDDTHITGNRSDVAVPESTAQKMSQTLEATRLEMDNELDLFNNKIKMVNNSIEMQDNKIEMQNNTITQFGNTIDQQNNIIEQQNNNITEIGNKVNSQGNNITEIGNKVNSQGNTITEIGNTIELQGSTIETLDSTVQTQGSTIETLDSTVQTQGSTIETLKSTVETQGSTIETLDSTVQTLDSKVQTQGSTIETLDSTVQTQGSTIETLDSTVQTLDSTVQTQGSTIQTLDSNVKIINSAFVIQDGKLTGLSEIVTNILKSGYVTTDLLNANVAWIENGKIKESAIGTTEIADASITTAKIDELSADVIKTGTIRTERLILTTDEVDPKTGEKKVALITALNAKVNAGEGNILDGAVIADETITAAKIDVVDLNAFKATIGNFTIGTSSMYNGKTSLKDPTNGVYIGTDGIALGQGSLLGMTDDSPFRVESDGDFHLGAKDGNYINFNAFTGALDINVSSLKIESSNVVERLDNIDENAIVEQVVEYYPSTSPTSLTGGSWSTSQPTWSEGIYIWSRTKNTNGKGESSYTTPVCITGNTGAQGPQGEQGIQGEQGEKGDTGATGVGVKSSDVTYQSSTSGTTVPTGTWSPSVPSVSAGSYLWTKTVITYTNNTTTTSYSVGKMGANGTNGTNGTNGKDGADGSDGRGIKSTAVTYQAWPNGTSTPTGTWESSPPSTTADKPYLWSKTVLTYTDNTTSTSYSVGSTPEGIVVGGRNLYLNSKNFFGGSFSGSISQTTFKGFGNDESVPSKQFALYSINALNGDYGGFYFFCDKTISNLNRLKKDETYTLSFWIKSSVECRLADYGIAESQTYISRYPSNWIVKTEWQKFEITFKYTSNNKFTDCFYASAICDLYISSPKLEIGNKATDWSPATEDTEESITEVKTIAEQTADKFSWLVKSGTSATNFELTDRTATLVANQINLNGLVTFSGLSSSAVSSITDTIEIGGRNLLPLNIWEDGHWWGSSTDSYFKRINITFPAGTYTFTKYKDISEYGDNIQFVFIKYNSETNTGDTNFSEVSNHYAGTQTLNMSYPFRIYVQYDITWDILNLILKVVKLEKGNKATDWTPAPEDTEAEIQSVKTIADNANNTIADWCYNNDKTYINGGKIYTGSITADQINVKDLFSKNITATNMTISGNSIFGNFRANTEIEGLKYINNNFSGLINLGRISDYFDEQPYGILIGYGSSTTHLQAGGIYIESPNVDAGALTKIHGGLISTREISSSSSDSEILFNGDLVPAFVGSTALSSLGTSSKKFSNLYTETINGTSINSTGKATTDGYGLTKLSTSTSSTSTALAATSSAVKTAYDKAKSAFSGKGLPWAVFSIIDEVNYTAWSEQAPSLTLRSSYSGDRTSTFSHGGAFYIYCPYAGRVEINFNLYVANVSSNGYLYARCYGYQYASDGSKELLDFTGMGAVTSSGSQANGTLVAEVKAGKYIYIVFCSSVSGKTNASSNTTDYKVRLQYRNIYD